MSASITLLTAAAATVGVVSAVKAVRRRIADTERRVDAVRRRQAERREAGVLDLEPDAITGVYGVPKPDALPTDAA